VCGFNATVKYGCFYFLFWWNIFIIIKFLFMSVWEVFCSWVSYFSNQARAGLWPARDWFLEIAFVHDVCMRVRVCVRVCVCVCVVCVCVSAPEAINN